MPIKQPSYSTAGFSDRLRSIIKPDSVLSFSKKCGLSDSLMRKYLSGSLPGLENLLKIATTSGVSLEWLATDKGPIRRETQPKDLNEFAYVDLIDVTLSAGGGAFVYSEGVKGYYAFKKEWLHKVCLEPSKAVLMKVSGDSMYPTFSDGDIVMIDTSRTRLIPGKIFALRINDTIMLKRLEPLLGGNVRIFSDNQLYKAYEAPKEDVHILGQAIWLAKEL